MEHHMKSLAILALLSTAVPLSQANDIPVSYNIVLIVVDGLRADHMGTYGYKRDTTPRLDKRARQAVIFDRAIAQGSWTLPSFATLFTSKYPESHHAITAHQVLSSSHTLVTEILHSAGLRTAGFVGGHFLDPVFGFSRGFDTYLAGGWGGARFFKQTAPQASRWIEKNKNKRFFVFVHGNDLHPPFNLPDQDDPIIHRFDQEYRGPVDKILLDYFFVAIFNDPVRALSRDLWLTDTPSPEYLNQVEKIRANPDDIKHIVAHYDEQIMSVDAAIDVIFETLKATGHEKDTIVILTGDHGLEWNEKGKLATAFHATVFHTVTHVPLMIWHPQLKPLRVKEPVELVDLAPTILEWLSLPIPQTFQGKSFKALAQGLDDNYSERYAFSSSSHFGEHTNSSQIFSVEDRRWKLIFYKRPPRLSLYDIEKDPNEVSDVKAEHPEIMNRLVHILSEHIGRPIPR